MRIKNSVFKAFNDQIVKRFTEAGYTSTPLSWNEEIPEFTFQTKAGEYKCHHGMNIDPENSRPLNHLEVMGRFSDPEKAKAFTDCNPYSGKWNHHVFDADAGTEADARRQADNIARKILSLVEQ